MTNSKRSDIKILKIIGKIYKIKDIKFEEIQEIIHDFAEEFLSNKLPEKIKNNNQEDIEKITSYNETIRGFLQGKIDLETLRRRRVECLILTDKLYESHLKNITAFIAKGLFDKGVASYDEEYGAYMYFETLLFTLQKLEDASTCEYFPNYISNHSVMKKYENSQIRNATAPRSTGP
ncbi:hypothetical protein AVKW3434_23685 [Acidovorax sp. SUPP3434]|uniref:hypothetical protein n=1 Tax=Acidovorax sp. SUPP3434 TaxID=2920880 RepID=UPI0023DE32DA|nr:hypothetical protein [Acidovorax sp. SUPP3434]GKT02448.1 hypothetical protein AVKW3434_23685 [Acidovorax sp. SUPP3434]